MAKHIGKLLIAFAIFASGGYARWTVSSNRSTESKAKELASYALDKLAYQASLHTQDSRADKYISMGNLRDDLLRNDFSTARRKKLWNKVQKKVEQNSNVRSMVREGRSGDVERIWEWVGAVGAIDDGRRQSGRFSLGPAFNEGSSAIATPDREQEMVQAKTSWDDSRPIY